MRIATGLRGRSLVTLPVFAAAVGLAISLVPTLLPRPLLVQGSFSAIVLVQSYGIGVLARALLRSPISHLSHRFTASRSWRRHNCESLKRSLKRCAEAAVGGILIAGVLAGTARSCDLLRHMGQPATSVGATCAAAGIAIILGTAVLLICRGLWWLVRRVLRSRRGRVVVLVPVLAVTGWATPLPAGALTSVGAQPSSGRIALGPKGRQFLASAPTAASIGRVTGRPATDPLRLYVGLDSADGPRARARLAVSELQRSGAFDRAAIVLVVPTGSGWVDPAGVGAIEYLYGGDVASVAVQYSRTPSWIAYLSGTEQARDTARALLDEVRERVTRLPAPRRPKVLVFGESLGALAAVLSQPSAGDLARRTDGALWVGVPAPARARAQQLAALSGRQTVLVHEEDPVAAWSPQLLYEPTRYWHRAWLPGVTFWQAVADLVSAYSTPTGYGHRYSREMVDAWWAAARPQASGSPTPDRLDDVRDAVEALADAS